MNYDTKVDFFFYELEKIVHDPLADLKTKVEALKAYSKLLPTISNDSLTVKHEVIKMDTSQLSNEEKINLLALIDKIEGEGSDSKFNGSST